MDGLGLCGLLNRYRMLQRSGLPLDALCIQEAVPCSPASIAASLGRRFTVAVHAQAPRLAIVYNRARLRMHWLHVYRLPKLTSVPIVQRLYANSSVEQKHALVCRLSRKRTRHRASACGITLVNFHLDTAGFNAHRRAQMHAISSLLAPRSRRWPLVACGDTNAFHFSAVKAERALARIVEPLGRHGAIDAQRSNAAPTHFFARANEPKLGHRIAVAFGRAGVDFPCRYDVVVAALESVVAGVLHTPESDHDLVWAALRCPRARGRALSP